MSGFDPKSLLPAKPALDPIVSMAVDNDGCIQVQTADGKTYHLATIEHVQQLDERAVEILKQIESKE